MEYVIGILSVILMVCIFVIINLLRKYEKIEEINARQYDLLLRLREYVSSVDNTINDLDDKGTFKSDDEIGVFFELIKEIKNILISFFK